MSTVTKILIVFLLIVIISGKAMMVLQKPIEQPQIPVPKVEEISQEGGQKLVISGSHIKVKAAEGKCLGISGGIQNLKNGIAPRFFPCDDNSSQKWNYNVNKKEINPSGDSNYCLNVPNSKANNGNELNLWSCHEGKNQDWSINNKEISTHLNENKCATYNNAGKLEIQDCASNDKQSFY